MSVFYDDPLPRRLGGLAATLGRISSSARKSTDPTIVASLLDEAKHLIEWTAADAEPETAAELVHMQRMISLWHRAWEVACQNPQQRICCPYRQKTGRIRPWIFRDWFEVADGALHHKESKPANTITNLRSEKEQYDKP